MDPIKFLMLYAGYSLLFGIFLFSVTGFCHIIKIFIADETIDKILNGMWALGYFFLLVVNIVLFVVLCNCK